MLKVKRVLQNLNKLRNENFLSQAIRVNHAGEYGAVAIYSGQQAVLSKTAVAEELAQMRMQEESHLQFFERKIIECQFRPTILLPAWKVLGVSLGVLTAALGVKAAMACTVAVEEVISDHYLEQMLLLEDVALRAQIAKICDEELEHRDIGIVNDAEQAFQYNILSLLVRSACKFAIIVSKVV